MELIGRKIRTLRKNKNMTQEQLAEVLSVSAQAVSKWENHISVPDIGLLPVIARYFGITMDELFNYRLDALNYKERFIRFMADNGVLKFGEFRLQSGRISPYYIDTGGYKSGAQIAKLGEFYAECIRENDIRTSLLFADTWDETPLMTAAAMVLYHKYGADIRYCISREAYEYDASWEANECGADNRYCISREAYGIKAAAMGEKPGARDAVTVIKDTLTSGDTLSVTLEKLKNTVKPETTSIIVSVDRMEKGKRSGETARAELEKEFGVKIYSIVTMDDIIGAVERGVTGGAEYLDAMKRYKAEYGGC